MTESITITHTVDGIRVTWPDGSTNIFANAVWLAEAYVNAMRNKEHARVLLVDNVAKELTRIESLMEAKGELRELRKMLVDASQLLH